MEALVEVTHVTSGILAGRVPEHQPRMICMYWSRQGNMGVITLLFPDYMSVFLSILLIYLEAGRAVGMSEEFVPSFLLWHGPRVLYGGASHWVG